jgi:hypothetical protein
MNYLIGAILILLCCGQAFGQKCAVDSGFRGAYFRTYYGQRHLVKTIRKLNELPPDVRARLDTYLKRKLGPSFAKRLKLDWGDKLDLKGLRREFPALYEENLPLGAYRLVFWFSDSAKGLKAYYTTVALNEDGTVSKEINLPDIGAEPNKAQLISCQDALGIAAGRGFPESRTSARFEYSPEHNSFIWTLTDSRRIDPPPYFGKGTYRTIDVEASTGKVLRIYEITIII